MSIVLLNYLIFFWIDKRRKWKYEDVVFDEKVRQAAFAEIQRTHKMLMESKEDYIDIQTTKRTTDALLKRI